ncbi:MAG: 50S ribosomal protein L35 [Chloroflexota bacterium]|jgi:large subunit ribosomal protein L35
MPKVKTRKAVAKRFSITGTGKLMRPHGAKSHLKRKKSGATRRSLNRKFPVAPSDAKRIRKLLPYGVP